VAEQRVELESEATAATKTAVVDGRWWIGGSPCSGKSTVAGILAASRRMRLYSCDDAFERHAAAVGAGGWADPGEGHLDGTAGAAGIAAAVDDLLARARA
jgi:hypothetical protein